MPGKKPITLKPSLFHWHVNTPKIRRTAMPLANAIRRYPLIRALEKALSSKVNQGKISKNLAGLCFLEIIKDVNLRVNDVDVEPKEIEKIRRESKTPQEEMRRIVHLALDRTILEDGLYVSGELGKESIEVSVKIVNKKPVIKLFVKLK